MGAFHWACGDDDVGRRKGRGACMGGVTKGWESGWRVGVNNNEQDAGRGSGYIVDLGPLTHDKYW